MTEPISQKEYYQFRAIFEPHQVRTDRVPGELDLLKNGLVRVYDVGTNTPTWFYNRGDERNPDTNRVINPAVPKALCGDKLNAELSITPVKLPYLTAHPDQREFVVRETLAASEKAVEAARKVLAKMEQGVATTNKAGVEEQRLAVAVAEAKHNETAALLKVEGLKKGSSEWKDAAKIAVQRQRDLSVAEAKLKLHQAQTAQALAQGKLDAATPATDKNAVTNAIVSASEKSGKPKSADKLTKELAAAKQKTTEAEKALADKEKELAAAPSTAFKPRSTDDYPEASTGRRLAFAKWVASSENPLTARVAMNHIWLRHFGRGIVATPADFGRNGSGASNPALLDWLAGELKARGWSMKQMHRLIVTSSTYRMVSTGDAADARIDPDNIYLWRMPSRRMEAEVVRDNVLYVSGNLDASIGGPDIDHNLGLTSKRRSLYLRSAAEKEVEFLKIFDGPSVTECYQRRPSVMPQQALALANSELALAEAKILCAKISATARANDAEFVMQAFQRILARVPSSKELQLCQEFLGRPEAQAEAEKSVRPIANLKGGAQKPKPDKKREDLILVLFNHNDFVTIR
jgi:hypothetical protein